MTNGNRGRHNDDMAAAVVLWNIVLSCWSPEDGGEGEKQREGLAYFENEAMKLPRWRRRDRTQPNLTNSLL